MKYTSEIVIDLPRKRVIELFDKTDNLYKWQPGLQSFEHISGESGQIGAVSKLKYKMGKREIEMTETIINRNLPDQFSATYEAKAVWNKVINLFSEVSSTQTKWVAENEFRFSGFMKIMAFIMPGAFKKQSGKYLVLFKNFAEKER